MPTKSTYFTESELELIEASFNEDENIYDFLKTGAMLLVEMRQRSKSVKKTKKTFRP